MKPAPSAAIKVAPCSPATGCERFERVLDGASERPLRFRAFLDLR
jgi:hypothetical protein